MPPTPEIERYKAAWQARRLRLAIFFLAEIALCAGLSLATHRWLIMACLIAMFGLLPWLYRFRCPRCGAIFWSRWGADIGRMRRAPVQCEHCGLGLNEVPQ